MIHAFADASMDHDDGIVSVGYVIYRSHNGDEELLETGTRVLHIDSHERPIDWCVNRAEYYGAIVATRVALDYAREPYVLHLDADLVVRAIKQRCWRFEGYFPHALFSFLGRFEDWHVRSVHRDKNERAHEQARVGLKIGRDIQRGVV